METTAILIKNLVKKYRKANDFAINGITLSIAEGEIYGLLGPNGSGKTTTISIACGLLRPTKGDVWICGKSVRHNLKEVKKRIGLAPQALALYSTLTLEENLKYFGALQGICGQALRTRIAECLQIAQLEKFAKHQINTFSGGMKRRANLIASIIHKPPVLFLDEPTVGVDPQSRNVIFENLKVLKNEGMTLIYTSHYMEEVQQLCTKVGILDHGNILIEGTPLELIQQTPNCNNLGEVFLALTGKQLRE